MLARNKLATAVKAAVLIGGGLTAMNTVAQETMEEVVVTGIRASLQNAQETKRNADYVSDVISAEDVGKFPDKNIADSLARMTGVAVSRDFGEGEKVSIRGAGPDYNRTTLNGQTVGSADWFILDNPARSFNYTLLPSTLISQLEVIKSPTASQTEGSLGGTVNVKTARPLDLEQGSGVVSVEGQYGEMADTWDPSVSGQYSWKNDEENFGILVSGVRQDRTVKREGFEVLGWSEDAATGVAFPTIMGAPSFNQDRERTTLFASAQFRANDSLLFTLDALDSKMDSNNDNRNWLIFSGDPAAGWVPNSTGADTIADVIANGTVSGSNTLTEASLNDGYGRSAVNWINRVSSTETKSVTLTTEFDNDDFSVDVVAGHTEAKGGTYRETSWEYGYGPTWAGGWGDESAGKNPSGGSWSYDLDNREINMNPAPNDADAFGAGWIWGGEKPTTDEETYFQADVEIPVEMGAFTAIKTGVKLRSAERTQGRSVYSWHAPGTATADVNPGWGGYLGYIFNTCPTLSDCGLNNKGEETLDINVGGNIGTVIGSDRELLEEYAFEGLQGVPADYAISMLLPENWAIEEDIFAAYIQADFETDNLRGNIGLRYVETDQTSTGYVYTKDSVTGELGLVTTGLASGEYCQPEGRADDGTVLGDCSYSWLVPDSYGTQDIDNSYREFLPSINVSYDLNDDMLVRFAAARVMARQNWNQLAANETYGDLSVVDPKGQAGNPNLKPNIANQYDVSFEYYYGDASSMAATFFFKDNKSYLEQGTYTDARYDQKNDVWVDVDFAYMTNGAGGTVQGIELAIQHDFDNGFGASANYTYTDTTEDNEDAASPVGISEHMANTSVYFENDDLSARVMYNYRSEWSNGFHWSGFPISTDAYGQFDASVSYYINDSLQLTAEAINLTNEEIYQFSEYQDRMVSLYENGRRFTLGARYSF